VAKGPIYASHILREIVHRKTPRRAAEKVWYPRYSIRHLDQTWQNNENTSNADKYKKPIKHP
jgi:hypothetical protein